MCFPEQSTRPTHRGCVDVVVPRAHRHQGRVRHVRVLAWLRARVLLLLLLLLLLLEHERLLLLLWLQLLLRPSGGVLVLLRAAAAKGPRAAACSRSTWL
jgi:hypothetical protein